MLLHTARSSIASFKEGKATQACDLFYQMMQQGISPNVVIYNSIIHALCKTGAMDKADVLLRQMVHKGGRPDNKTYNSLIHGYSTHGQWMEAGRMMRILILRL
jgi:pentatricopeptide repeat protein